MFEDKDFIVTGAVLAAFFHITARSIQRYAADGHLAKAPGRDKYFYVASLEKTIRRLQARVDEAAEVDDPEMRQAKLLKLQAEQRISERRDLVESKTLIPLADLEGQWSRLICGCRSNFIALPARARLHLGLTKKQVTLLKDMVHDTLVTSSFVEGAPPLPGGEPDRE
jgi:hypothetical protein